MTKNDYKLSVGTLRICNFGSNFDIFFFSDNNECDFQMNISHDDLSDFPCKENVESLSEDFCEKYFNAKSEALSDGDIKTLKDDLEMYVYPHSADQFSKKNEIYNKSEAVQTLLEYKRYKEDWESDDTFSSTIIVPEKNELMQIIMVGDDECFDLDEFYQYVIDENGHIYRAYYDFRDENGNELEDLGNIDYSHPYRIKDVTNEFER